MKKTTNVKATKLMIDDHLKLSGRIVRITHLTKTFGRGEDRVNIHGRYVGKRRFANISVPASTRFTIYNQK